jgi:hypothetical protein
VLQGNYYLPGNVPVRTFDIAPDGKRFLMIKAGSGDGTSESPKIVVVEHWFTELQQRVPTR